MSEAIRIAVVSTGGQVPAWEASMVESLAALPGVEVGLIIDESPLVDDAPLAFRCYEWLDNRLFGLFDNPLARVPMPKSVAHWSLSDTEEMLDLVICLSAARKDTVFGRYGALWVEAVDDEGHGLSPVGYHEVMRRWRSSAIAVRHRRKPGVSARVIHCSRSSTDAISMRRNREQILWKARDFIPRLVARALRNGGVFPGCAASTQPVESKSTCAGVGSAALLAGDAVMSLALDDVCHEVVRGYPSTAGLVGQFAHKLPDVFRFYYHAKLTREQWYLMFQFSDRISLGLDSYQAIVPPKDRIWADPHLLEKDDVWYVFIEEMLFSENKGFISVLQIDAQGAWTQPVKVLERDYHLSYPQIVEWDGEIYMLPESSANRTIELYRCIDFPLRWERVKVLIDDIEAVDSSLLWREGKWWLFCSVKPHPAASENDELHIYYSDDLLTGQWQPHAANPVVSDVTRARPAGRIFEHNGQLVRPSQNCGGIYGFGLNLNRITCLDETSYEEQIIDHTSAAAYPGMIATHTLAREGRLTVVDACRRISVLG